MTRKVPAVLDVGKGATVVYREREYQILRVLDLHLVMAREEGSGEKVVLKLGDLGPKDVLRDGAEDKRKEESFDLEAVPEDDWAIADARFSVIEPFFKQERVPKGHYAVAAKMAGVSVATLYRWIRDYGSSRMLSSLLPERRPGGAGKGRLPEEVELIIRTYIKDSYLTLQKPSLPAAVKEIRRLCFNAGLPTPATNTVRLRVEWISDKERVGKRQGAKAARQFDPLKHSIPDADWPLAMVQVDHTVLPVIIVDDEHRLPIRRPIITIAFDVFSRVILGMYLSLDPPSAMSTGMCLTHAILGKDRWLQERDLDEKISWPFYGMMGTLHMDNAREFRGSMLAAACREYTIDLHLRPVARPEYGAHIERLMGTLTQRLKSVKGATFSGPQEKGEYDAEAEASMTFGETEKWLALTFAEYHREVHRGIGTTPFNKWREGILGTKTRPPRGLPPHIKDEEKLRIDFMPFEERGIYDYGVVWDRVHYYHDVLRPWMNLKEPGTENGRKFRFRRDPRDISQLYFFDAESKRYFSIPYRDTSHPPLSVWELRVAQDTARSRGQSPDDERIVFGIATERRELEDSSAEKTKAARSSRQRRKTHEKARKDKARDLPRASAAEPTAAPDALEGYDPDQIEALDDDD